MADGRKRTVQADVLRTCCHELKDRIDPRGLQLSNAIVTGGLDLSGLVVPFSLRFSGCEFDIAPMVEGAQLFELSLTGSRACRACSATGCGCGEISTCPVRTTRPSRATCS